MTNINYVEYIGSTRWRNSPARWTALELSGFRCWLCNVSQDVERIEVHHRTYERLGCERADDLIALCSRCHHGVTDMLRRRRYVLRRPRSADVIFAIIGASPLFDPTRKGV